MKEVSATDIKTVRTQKPSQKSSNEEEPPFLEDPKSREEPTSQRSKEELLTLQTYTSPDSTANKDFKSSITDPLDDQKSLSCISSSSNGECKPQDNKCVEDIGLETAISGLSEISVDSELSSDLSEELFDNDILITKQGVAIRTTPSAVQKISELRDPLITTPSNRELDSWAPSSASSPVPSAVQPQQSRSLPRHVLVMSRGNPLCFPPGFSSDFPGLFSLLTSDSRASIVVCVWRQ